MAVGFGPENGLHMTINAGLDNALDFIRSTQYKGDTPEFCEECDEPIPEARRMAISTAYCVQCQTVHDNIVHTNWLRVARPKTMR
ncbi:putative zinc-finger containing protein [Aeromonas phage SW69-9]|uniref:Zinc finger DksA/TraR C4-type domain-containing protein n=3 Tax=Biquartavirus TaxID=1912143 RepID=Q6U9H2_9CAUD|nr:DksA-like zinc-finger protein [Aeromonas phage 44RR2.8t]APU00601.1 putative zinc-finger containing protein [Aeromonas phage 44RR2.8t.2]APU01932.1 putative zinc-finger containing protein [Aeromonas phage L9-6]APU02184.1 putative zinc-finger containing protein [Aeromonas phage Riv-10]APU02430.1 putative zinc-finger containing protein [Aeromonas phage SW69-9]UYD59684.1 hypothetical protein JNMOADIG_00172 [Aeromonas phage avDM5]UYD60586.1 hypothetical protein NPHMPGLK_00251 [Aeromonas phage av